MQIPDYAPELNRLKRVEKTYVIWELSIRTL